MTATADRVAVHRTVEAVPGDRGGHAEGRAAVAAASEDPAAQAAQADRPAPAAQAGRAAEEVPAVPEAPADRPSADDPPGRPTEVARPGPVARGGRAAEPAEPQTVTAPTDRVVMTEGASGVAGPRGSRTGAGRVARAVPVPAATVGVARPGRGRVTGAASDGAATPRHRRAAASRIGLPTGVLRIGGAAPSSAQTGPRSGL